VNAGCSSRRSHPGNQKGFSDFFLFPLSPEPSVTMVVENGADLGGANVSETNVQQAMLQGSNLVGANLTDSDLRKAESCAAIRPRYAGNFQPPNPRRPSGRGLRQEHFFLPRRTLTAKTAINRSIQGPYATRFLVPQDLSAELGKVP